MAKEIISASIEASTIQDVLKIAQKDNKRSFSAMVDILLAEAVAARKKLGTTRNKQTGSGNAKI